MLFTKNGASLAEAIKHAIDDHVITNAEYDEIMRLAHADEVIDPQEQALLKELNAMIGDGTIKRVP
jgi:hypothetical protein